MIVIPEERFVESPYIEWVAHGYTVADGLAMRPAQYNWHLIFTQHEGVLRTLVVGALEAARPLSYVAICRFFQDVSTHPDVRCRCC